MVQQFKNADLFYDHLLYIGKNKPVSIYLVTGNNLKGYIQDFDENFIKLIREENGTITVNIIFIQNMVSCQYHETVD